MQKTKIEYLDYTWNPIAMRCTPVTDGCKNCWHLNWCKRFGNSQKTIELIDAYRGLEPVWKEDFVSPKKPSIIGVQYMGDLFHNKIPVEWINEICHIVNSNHQHKFIMLSKRPKRMEHFFRTKIRADNIPNLHLGVSISTNDDLWMVDKLLEIPAAVRFVSVEPMLGRVDLVKYMNKPDPDIDYDQQTEFEREEIKPYLDWIICGAETGPGKRKYQPIWGRTIKNECQVFGIPFFFKQDGDGNNTIDGKIYQEYPR